MVLQAEALPCICKLFVRYPGWHSPLQVFALMLSLADQPPTSVH